eukprot:6141241-Prymnesium_polylepis.1
MVLTRLANSLVDHILTFLPHDDVFPMAGLCRELRATTEAWAEKQIAFWKKRASSCFRLRTGAVLSSHVTGDLLTWRSEARAAQQCHLYALGGIATAESFTTLTALEVTSNGQIVSGGCHGLHVWETRSSQDRPLLTMQGGSAISPLDRLCVSDLYVVSLHDASLHDTESMSRLSIHKVDTGVLHMELGSSQWSHVYCITPGPSSSVFLVHAHSVRVQIEQWSLETGELLGTCSLGHGLSTDLLNFVTLCFHDNRLFLHSPVKDMTGTDEDDEAYEAFLRRASEHSGIH